MKGWMLFLAMAGAAEASEPAEPALTVGEAVQIALERHPDVGKARAASEALKGKIRQVRAQALPEI